jgi:hypothetical protein
MNIPQEFFDTLGQYVYCFGDPNLILSTGEKPVYVGKGNKNRCISHIKSKDYDLDNCYIIARNLERFEDKQDFQSFLLESFCINFFKPVDNVVSGHYKECFVMAKLSDLFDEYKNNLHDNFEKLPDWYIENYSKLKGKINSVIIKSDNVFLLSPMNNSLQMCWYWYANSENRPLTVKFLIQVKDDDKKYQEKEKHIQKFVEANGYKAKDLRPENRNGLILDVNSINDAIDLLDNFM